MPTAAFRMSAIRTAWSEGNCHSAAQTPTVAPAPAEDARLSAFLDEEFAQEIRDRPQLATQFGMKDRLDDNSDAASSGVAPALRA